MSDLTERIANLQDPDLGPGNINRMHLLEASAGTGKTYSIQSLYLRLVLIEGLTVQQILVVTFTKDATKELRDRLQRVLRDALDYLNGTLRIKDAKDRTKLIVDLAKGEPDSETAKQRLQLALLDFDMAAIYTIHGFCQRVLNRFAFETGQAFDIEPADDTKDEIEQLCRDWWRKNIYSMDESAAGLLCESGGFTLDAVTQLARKLIGKPDAVLDGVNGSIKPAVNALSHQRPSDCEQAVYKAAMEIRDVYRQGRPSSSTASFDDYLINLRDALKRDNDLADVLRKEFHAALIDEFQDTDPIQWGIFERLFKDASVPCFLVGDPKQAIYRFRNGDVETYLKATESVRNAKYPLKKNFRSEKRLIDAVNQVFIDSTVRNTFGDNIEYKEALDAAGKKHDRSLLVNGTPDDKPFKILMIPNSRTKGGVPGKTSKSAITAYKLTAAEIARILHNDKITIAGRPVARKDIAVLVRQHAEGDFIAQELKKLNIPSVRQGTGNVWHTDEGSTIWTFLETILDSRSLSKVRHALLSPWRGLNFDQIQQLNNGESVLVSVSGENRAYGLEDWVKVFDDLHETWLKRGYPAMFRQLTDIFEIKKRCLGNPDRQGQRRLANISHLSEMIEGKIIKDRKTPEGVLSWVRRQFNKDTEDKGDEVTLRLETDDDAVRIMTIFTSKGLEFPIVFAPTLFLMSPWQRGGIYEYHDESGMLHIAANTADDTITKKAKESEKQEMLREHVRQIYVALTRAVHRTIVFALDSGTKDGKPTKGENQKYRMTGTLGEVLNLPMLMTDNDGEKTIGVDLDSVNERFSNIGGVDCAVEVKEWSHTGSDLALALPSIDGIMNQPPQKPKPDISKGHGSFSSLAPGESKAAGSGPLPASIETDPKNRDAETASITADAATKPEGIFTFPAGARTGTCWHEIFEDLSFDATDEQIASIVKEKLQIHGFLKNDLLKEERIKLTAEMTGNVLTAELPHLAGKDPFTLQSIKAGDRKTEWEFNFATLTGKRTSELQEAIARHKQYRDFAVALGKWDNAIPGGYLTGFVDLLFRKDGRYYIADWKSNRRNGKQKDFDQAGMNEEMSLHRYWLQYLIYSVAVQQYLSKAMTDYSYQQHFGGVYYIFLRGVNGLKDEAGNTNGVFADLPPETLIEELSRILGDFE